MDLESYVRRSQKGPCFVCALVAGSPDQPEHIVYEDDETIAFLGRAVSDTVPTERLYVMSLGSQQGNRHVHWHLAPLPPGVPYQEQQFYACMAENGVLDIKPEEQADLANRLREALAR